MSKFDLNAIQAAIAADAEVSADMNHSVKGGGGDYTPPAEGTCGLRFVGYIELGKHEGSFQGKPKVSDEVKLIFELFGPKWEPKEFDGVKVPQRITVNLNKSLNEKAGFFKLFKAMNYEGKAKTMAQLLGQAFIGKVFHKKFKFADGKDGVSAQLRDPNTGAFTIGAPFVEDLDTGEVRRRDVPEPLTELRCFLWNVASQAMWDSIFIDGEYEAKTDDEGNVTKAAKTKNVFQARIKEAINFEGSPIDLALKGGVETGEEKTVEEVKAAQAAAKKKREEAAAAKAAETPQPQPETPVEQESTDEDLPF